MFFHLVITPSFWNVTECYLYIRLLTHTLRFKMNMALSFDWDVIKVRSHTVAVQLSPYVENLAPCFARGSDVAIVTPDEAIVSSSFKVPHCLRGDVTKSVWRTVGIFNSRRDLWLADNDMMGDVVTSIYTRCLVCEPPVSTTINQ
jgi:hypothetical protein